jgi:hypothetical protein
MKHRNRRNTGKLAIEVRDLVGMDMALDGALSLSMS